MSNLSTNSGLRPSHLAISGCSKRKSAHEECDFMATPLNCTSHQFFCNLTREQQICRLGWLLLFLWLATVLWMTKDLWCCNSSIEAASEECILNNDEETRRSDFGTAC